MEIATALGVVIGLGLTMIMFRAFYVNYTLSRARKATRQIGQQAMNREIQQTDARNERRRNRMVARSGRGNNRGGPNFFDLESGLREPPPVHLTNENDDVLPLYELPPEYEAITKPYRRPDGSLDLPISYDELERRESASSSSSSAASESSETSSEASSTHREVMVDDDEIRPIAATPMPSAGIITGSHGENAMAQPPPEYTYMSYG